MKSKIHSLQEENDMLKKKKNDLNFNADSTFLKEKIKILEVNNGSLKIENDNLKKQIEEYREDLEKMRSLIKRVYEETNNDALASYAQ
ncbi:MAG: hypothetical protein J5965_04950 [Aeriscardovia sp.]|nr:hypothetical protein [Aeriscardovia sp.]